MNEPILPSADPLAGLSYNEQQDRRQAWWPTKGFQDGFRFKVRNLAKDWTSGEWGEGGNSLMALRGLVAQFPKPEAIEAATKLLETPGRPRPLPQDLWSTAHWRRQFFKGLMDKNAPQGVLQTWMAELGQAWQWVIDEPLPPNQGWKHPFIQARRGHLPRGLADRMLADGILDRMTPDFLANTLFNEALFRNDAELLDILDSRGVRPDNWGNGALHYLARRYLHGAIERYGRELDPQEHDDWGLNAAHAAASRLSGWRKTEQNQFVPKTPAELAVVCHRLAATLLALKRMGVDIDAPAPKPPKATPGERRGVRSKKVCKEGETLWQVLRRREEPDPETGKQGDLPPGTLAQIEALLLLNSLPPGHNESPEDFIDGDEEEVSRPAPVVARPRARL